MTDGIEVGLDQEGRIDELSDNQVYDVLVMVFDLKQERDAATSQQRSELSVPV